MSSLMPYLDGMLAIRPDYRVQIHNDGQITLRDLKTKQSKVVWTRELCTKKLKEVLGNAKAESAALIKVSKWLEEQTTNDFIATWAGACVLQMFDTYDLLLGPNTQLEDK